MMSAEEDGQFPERRGEQGAGRAHIKDIRATQCCSLGVCWCSVVFGSGFEDRKDFFTKGGLGVMG